MGTHLDMIRYACGGLVANPEADIGGTGLIGEVDASYQTMVDLFGEPSHQEDYSGDKIDVEWFLETHHKEVITIYNWKDGKNYLGDDDGLPVKEIRCWHIGGKAEEMETFQWDKFQKLIHKYEERKGRLPKWVKDKIAEKDYPDNISVWNVILRNQRNQDRNL